MVVERGRGLVVVERERGLVMVIAVVAKVMEKKAQKDLDEEEKGLVKGKLGMVNG